jgi:N-acetyl-alpha-D-muramate 1-phosphate uridylyltransferase
MRPLTDTVPKAMLEVAGRPFVEHLLEKIVSCGFEEVVFLLGRFGEQIVDHVGDGTAFGIRVRYSDEGEAQLGTAGAVRHALDLLEPTFLITYGDSYLPFDYAAALDLLRVHDDCDGVMAVYANENKWDASNVITDGTWVTAYEKGTQDPAFDHIDYGAMALRREIIAALPEGRSALDVVQHEIAAARRLRAYVARDRFFEIGSKDGLATLSAHLSAS